MKIDFLCNDGSPLGVTMKSLWGEDHRIGIGGSEYAMLTLCEQWTNEGHTVRLYNNPYEKDVSEFEQLPLDAFNKADDRDILIVFRSPNKRAIGANGKKVWFSCDQFTNREIPFGEFSCHVDKIVCISDYHAKYFETVYNIKGVDVIDLPVRIQDFPDTYEKIPNRIIFTSVPDRGLMNLHAIWPLIKRDVSDATLAITSDYRLWGVANAQNQQYRIHWVMSDDVDFLGALDRKTYLDEICRADIFAYPVKAQNAELFCISCAEAQYAGAYPVTSDQGALETTNMGLLLMGDAEKPDFRIRFANKVAEILSDREKLEKMQKDVKIKMKDRCNPDNISKIWMERIF